MKRYQEIVKLCKINNQVYQILNLIGKGGFSEVYQVMSLKEKKNYAMKQMNLANQDEESVKSLLNEIEVMKKLKNKPRCIQVYDHEWDKSRRLLHIVMELGSTDLSTIFKSEIAKHSCVPEPDRAFYWKKMLLAVQAIHREGIIHSDIKPANFVVCAGAEIKLIDFNISNAINERTSITLNFDCGTLMYMAPESICDSDAKRINQKVDVWALGVILFLMTYGKLPYAHLKKQAQVIFAICDPKRAELKFAPLADGQDELIEAIDVSFIDWQLPNLDSYFE